ncbi:hypothetical protein SAMN05421870_101676 [Streptomyces qinglanensis]|uniref:Uncharacterized protein n=1 Tax=Streptomyces qinglanensis TaxID=943816 RepID=A0A1H9NVF1_9ACTN|nr:hypothetical protein SAMN05421870_101676 [Streptomyces qinglanensis]
MFLPDPDGQEHGSQGEPAVCGSSRLCSRRRGAPPRSGTSGAHRSRFPYGEGPARDGRGRTEDGPAAHRFAAGAFAAGGGRPGGGAVVLGPATTGAASGPVPAGSPERAAYRSGYSTTLGSPVLPR